jgi:anti-sigma regulatory factor (Ser/Thr protein kinase)
VVELTVAVESDLLVLARLTTSTVAARSSFDIEEIEDLRLAVDELCLSVLQGRRSGRLHLRVDGSSDQIEVWCRYEGHDEPVDDGLGADEDTDGLSGRILDALVDEHGPVSGEGWHGSRLCKRRVARDG